MEVVLDVNVIVSALLAPTGVPAVLLLEWQRGAFEVVVSPLLLEELAAVLEYPKIAVRIDHVGAQKVLGLFERAARFVDDRVPPNAPEVRDPDDQYLVHLAASEQVGIVTGDRGLLALAPRLPIFSPVEFAQLIHRDG